MLNHIAKEWGVLKGAPIAFFILLVLGLGGGFAGGMMFRGQEVTNLKTLLDVKDAQRSLSEQQLTDIKSRLKEAPPSSVDILGYGARAEQLKSAFSDSGWQADIDRSPSNKQNLVLRAQDGKSATTIERALKDAGVTYQAVTPSNTGGTDFLLGTEK